jgi:hypothetical protein
MATKLQQMQTFARYCREQEGRDLMMQEVALLAKKAGWKMPAPKDPVEILAKEFSKAEREEMEFDAELGESYHVNIAYPTEQGMFWADIDRADRKKMAKNVVLRRDQMLGDGLQLTIDAMHWNRVNPDEEPVQVPLDFGDEVEWRLNAPKAKKKGA